MRHLYYVPRVLARIVAIVTGLCCSVWKRSLLLKRISSMRSRRSSDDRTVNRERVKPAHKSEKSARAKAR